MLSPVVSEVQLAAEVMRGQGADAKVEDAAQGQRPDHLPVRRVDLREQVDQVAGIIALLVIQGSAVGLLALILVAQVGAQSEGQFVAGRDVGHQVLQAGTGPGMLVFFQRIISPVKQLAPACRVDIGRTVIAHDRQRIASCIGELSIRVQTAVTVLHLPVSGCAGVRIALRIGQPHVQLQVFELQRMAGPQTDTVVGGTQVVNIFVVTAGELPEWSFPPPIRLSAYCWFTAVR